MPTLGSLSPREARRRRKRREGARLPPNPSDHGNHAAYDRGEVLPVLAIPVAFDVNETRP
jgi:hypothetical protein